MKEQKNEKQKFQEFTDLPALKQNAEEKCGKEFIKNLKQQGIGVASQEFWLKVNQKLNVPEDILEQKKAKEQAEKERLLANKKELYSKNRNGWKITVFELPEPDKYGNKFVAEYTQHQDSHINTNPYFSKSANDAYSFACNYIDINAQEQAKIENFQLIKPFYLALLYISGSDLHSPYPFNLRNKKCKENFTGIEHWNGLRFDIINQLEKEGLIELSNSRKTITMNKEAMRQARDFLKTLNIPEAEMLLAQREYHEEYINYKHPLEEIEDEAKEEFEI